MTSEIKTSPDVRQVIILVGLLDCLKDKISPESITLAHFLMDLSTGSKEDFTQKRLDEMG